MVILGIDPGLATLGWGVIDAQPGRQRLIEYGCILTTPDQRFPERLKQIGEDMRALLQRFQPEEIAFEELFFAKNVTTALNVGLLFDASNWKYWVLPRVYGSALRIYAHAGQTGHRGLGRGREEADSADGEDAASYGDDRQAGRRGGRDRHRPDPRRRRDGPRPIPHEMRNDTDDRFN